jgi:hypothetical protein
MKEKFNELLEQVGEELEEDEEQSLECIQETLENIQNIIRFLDGKIITSLSYVTNSRGNLQVIAEYFREPGILIYENKEPRELENQRYTARNEFTEQENIPQDKLERFFGDEVYLTREGELWVFTKDEIISPRSPEKQKTTTVRQQEKSIEEILHDYPDFEEKFYGCFKKVVINAIEKNPKKRGIFQKIIDYINRLEAGELLDEEDDD